LIANWSTSPSAKACHPREEHLIPLFAVAGAGLYDRQEGNSEAKIVFDTLTLKVKTTGFMYD
jgi:aromatic ring-opening dioxygenase catalytic subunit (LigB family)